MEKKLVPENDVFLLIESIKYVEMTRINLYKQLASVRVATMEGYLNERLPKAEIEQFGFNGDTLIKLKYEGMLPLYNKDSKDKYYTEIRVYYIQASSQAYWDAEINIRFDRPMILITHYFPDNSIRDLDNRNRKLIIDAVKMLCVMEDDDWQNLSITERGEKTELDPYIEVIVGEENTVLEYMYSHIKTEAQNNRRFI